MGKHPGLKRVLVGVVLAVLFIAGYVAASVGTSCDAKAQICCQGLGLFDTEGSCIGIATGFGPAESVMDTVVVVPGITYVALQVMIYYTVSIGQFAIKVLIKIGKVINNWVNWWDTFWYYDLNPVLQDMTKEMQLLDSLQARAIGGFKDAVALNKAIAERRKQQVDSRTELAPGENVCSAGSLSGGMTQAQVLSDKYNAAIVSDHLVRTGNAVGTAAANGRVSDLNSRYANYCLQYYDPGDNAGYSGCVGAPKSLYPNADLDIPGRIFQRKTIAMRDPDTKRVVDDMMRNLANPFANNLYPRTSFKSAKGQENILRLEAMKARRQAVFSALYHVVSRRVPSTGSDTQVHEVNLAAGLLPGVESPSKNELMDVLASLKNRTADYATRQIDEPNNAEREGVIQAGVRTRQLSDILDLTDRMSLIVATQVGLDLETMKPTRDQSDSIPMH
jgi:hypothetical protein